MKFEWGDWGEITPRKRTTTWCILLGTKDIFANHLFQQRHSIQFRVLIYNTSLSSTLISILWHESSFPVAESRKRSLTRYVPWKNNHDDGIKWKHSPRYWPFVRGIHRSPVNSPHKGQWRGDLMFSLICAWINGWVNNREAGDLRRHRAHYDVIVMTFRVDIENAVQMYFSKILVIDRLTPKHICDCAELLACMKRIPIIQIRWSWDPLIFVMPIPIPIKTVLLSYLDQLYYIAWQRGDINGDGNGQHIALGLQGTLALQDNWTLSVTPDILHHTADVLVPAEGKTGESWVW